MKSTKNAAKVADLKPSKKVTQAPPTPVSAPAKSAPVTVAKPAPAATLATIDVKLDVGYGNAVYLRGQGAGLSWERGVALSCVDPTTWRWSGEVKTPVTFKLLINDQIWSAGNDLTVAPGQKIEVAPAFA